MVGLYFSSHAHPLCLEFSPIILEVYKELKEKGQNFEIVLISMDDEDEIFKKWFETIPWLALPFNDKICEKLIRYFKLKIIPTVVIIGSDGKILTTNAAELNEEHGIQAYPFSPEKLDDLAEIERARDEAQTLESILIYGEQSYLIKKGGFKVPVSELIGKNILLYFSAHRCAPCHAFLPKLIQAYQEIKAKDNAFEIIFIPSDRDESSFNNFFSSMPWLALPFGDERKAFLQRRLKIKGIPALVAIGPSGRTHIKEALHLIEAYGANIYPFTEEHLKHLEGKFEEEAKTWPEKVNHELHTEHDLVLTRRTTYFCDGCKEMGLGWSFLCEICDFDLHPKCTLKEDEGTKNEKANEGWICDGDVCRAA